MAYHPDDTLLRAYATGDIDTARGVAIASHVDHCHQCRETVARFEEYAASALDDIEVVNASNQDEEAVFSNMLADIMTLDADLSRPKVRSAATITVNDKSFQVPASLQPLVDRMGEWRSYGGKVFTSTVDIDENYRVNLLYITEGVQVPQHTHKGIESTLVLHGEFSDEMGRYSKGDYLEEDGETKHAPQTAVGQDCLCLSILTEPMVFTQGVARIFNRFGKGMYP